jgi:hypothetical protein
MTGGVARAALGPIELPLTPQAIEMAHTDVKGGMSLGDLVEQESTRTLRVVAKELPYQGLLGLTELSAGTKGWTCRWIEFTLAWGEGHDVILLEPYSWIKSVRLPLGVNVHFYLKQNQLVRTKIAKLCQKSVIRDLREKEIPGRADKAFRMTGSSRYIILAQVPKGGLVEVVALAAMK